MAAATWLLDWGAGFSGFLAENLLALVALAFLLAPSLFLPRRGPGPEYYGLDWRNLRRGLVWAGGASAVTLALFIPSHYGWMTVVEDQALDFDLGNYRRLPDRYWGEPPKASDDAVVLFHEGQRVVARWDPKHRPWRFELATDGDLARIAGPGQISEAPPAHWEVSSRDARSVGLTARVRDASYLELSATVEGHHVPRDDYILGVGGHAPEREDYDQGTLRLSFGVGWLLSALLVQLLLVALPEEFFYRGFLQRRLEQATGRAAWPPESPGEETRRRPLLSPANVMISALFALGHFVIGWDPQRLAVFFPSLAFGYLRDRTDGLTAPIVYHAACNIMVILASVHYVPA